MKNVKLATKISIFVIPILALGLILLWRIVDTNVSSVMEEQVLQEMNDAAKTRSEIVEQYVQAAESYLIGFGQSLELKEVLNKPNNTSIVSEAQGYTESYGGVNPNMENIYLADYNSVVLTSVVKGLSVKHFVKATPCSSCGMRFLILMKYGTPVSWLLPPPVCRLSPCIIRYIMVLSPLDM